MTINDISSRFTAIVNGHKGFILTVKNSAYQYDSIPMNQCNFVIPPFGKKSDHPAHHEGTKAHGKTVGDQTCLGLGVSQRSDVGQATMVDRS